MKDILNQEDWLNKNEGDILNLSVLTNDEDDEDQTIFSANDENYMKFVKEWNKKYPNKVWTIKEGIPEEYPDDYELPEEENQYYSEWFIYKGFDTGAIGYYLMK